MTTAFSMNTNWSKTPMFDVDPYSLPCRPGRKNIPFQKHTYECTDTVDELFNGLSLGEKGETPKETAVRMGRILYSHRGGEEELCAICLDSMKGHNVQFTPCGHGFHSKCLHKWTGENEMRSCPACRTDMFPNDAARNRTLFGEDHSTRDLVMIWTEVTGPIQIDSDYSSSAEDSDGNPLSQREAEHVNEIYDAWLQQENDMSDGNGSLTPTFGSDTE